MFRSPVLILVLASASASAQSDYTTVVTVDRAQVTVANLNKSIDAVFKLAHDHHGHMLRMQAEVEGHGGGELPSFQKSFLDVEAANVVDACRGHVNENLQCRDDAMGVECLVRQAKALGECLNQYIDNVNDIGLALVTCTGSETSLPDIGARREDTFDAVVLDRQFPAL